MSVWQDHKFVKKITDILERFIEDEPHHFGQPFVSVYQIAVIFDKEHPEAVEAANKEMSGKGEGVGVGKSLQAYIALNLSKNIKSGAVTEIEGAWLSSEGISEITFVGSAEKFTGQGNTKHDAFSMFRKVI